MTSNKTSGNEDKQSLGKQAEIAKYYENSKSTIASVAQKYNVSEDFAREAVRAGRALDVVSAYGNRVRDSEKEAIGAYICENKSLSEIAKSLGRSEGFVRKYALGVYGTRFVNGKAKVDAEIIYAGTLVNGKFAFPLGNMQSVGAARLKKDNDGAQSPEAQKPEQGIPAAGQEPPMKTVMLESSAGAGAKVDINVNLPGNASKSRKYSHGKPNAKVELKGSSRALYDALQGQIKSARKTDNKRYSAFRRDVAGSIGQIKEQLHDYTADLETRLGGEQTRLKVELKGLAGVIEDQTKTLAAQLAEERKAYGQTLAAQLAEERRVYAETLDKKLGEQANAYKATLRVELGKQDEKFKAGLAAVDKKSKNRTIWAVVLGGLAAGALAGSMWYHNHKYHSEKPIQAPNAIKAPAQPGQQSPTSGTTKAPEVGAVVGPEAKVSITGDKSLDAEVERMTAEIEQSANNADWSGRHIAKVRRMHIEEAKKTFKGADIYAAVSEQYSQFEEDKKKIARTDKEMEEGLAKIKPTEVKA
jgi:hypothetical protein